MPPRDRPLLAPGRARRLVVLRVLCGDGWMATAAMHALREPGGDPVKPTVDEPSDEYRAVCAYSPQPDDPSCDARATLHLIVGSDVPTATDGLVGLPSCDAHAPIARAAGRFIAEHEHAGVCGLPGSIWLPDANVCVIDDSGVEPTYEKAEAPGA